MTIQGAMKELVNLLNADDIPVYYKDGIEKVIETIDDYVKRTADRKTEPQRDCFLCKWLGNVDVCGRCRNRNLFAEADTEPTISKMEQVEDEPQTEDACEGCVNKTDCPWK